MKKKGKTQANAARKTYTAPKLRDLGKVTNVTTGGSTGDSEKGDINKPKKSRP